MMRIVKVVMGFLGLLMVGTGILWLLQRLDILGGILAIVGSGLLYWAARTAGLPRGIVGLLGSMMMIVGFIWILQGLNILPGSFMTGVLAWAYRGTALAVVGAAVTLWATRASGVGKDIVGGLGALLILMGCIWALQGAGILPVGVMAGVFAWVYRGALLAAIGAGLMFWAIRRARV